MPSSLGLFQALKLISLSGEKGKNKKVRRNTELCHKALHESLSLDKVSTITLHVNESGISMSGKCNGFLKNKVQIKSFVSSSGFFRLQSTSHVVAFRNSKLVFM